MMYKALHSLTAKETDLADWKGKQETKKTELRDVSAGQRADM